MNYINKTHIRVQAASADGVERTDVIILPPGFWQRRDEVLPRGEAFLKGTRLYDYPGLMPEFWSNTSNCFHAITNYTWITIPHYLDFVTNAQPTYWEKWQITTESL